jgi:hypothetical protein
MPDRRGLLDIKRESAGAHPTDAATREDLEKRIIEAMAKMSIEDIEQLIAEMEASLSA